MDELRKRQKIISQLVEARLEQGISQAELARRLGIQRSGINRLESGTQNPTLDMILKIASALGKDVSLELNDKEEPMSNVYSLRIYDTELPGAAPTVSVKDSTNPWHSQKNFPQRLYKRRFFSYQNPLRISPLPNSILTRRTRYEGNNL